MQLDIALLVIIVIFTILGFKNGFVYTLFATFGWLIAIIVAFFTRDMVIDFLKDKTGVYDWYHERVYNICLKFTSGYTDRLTGGNAGGAAGGAIEGLDGGALEGLDSSALEGLDSGALEGLTGGALDRALEAAGGADSGALAGALEAVGGAVGGAVGAVGEKIAQTAADQLASASFGVFCFIATVLVIKLILFLLTLAFSRRHRGGFVGAIDAIGGMLIGIAQGFIIVFIVLLLILPVSLAINPWLFEKVSGALNASFFAETLFIRNPLIALIDGFAPGLFDPAEWLDKIGNL
ncbi:MAG: CvpA family protein [Clostridiales Family XIII bacterium]|jgi:uncharacterized membrane protein required for colicin V production|nr:CvpA family protein [Clostridiales Family XIII bacterium]